MVIDYKQFKPGQPIRDGLLWILEQLPSLIEARDMTDTLRGQSYWPSYNCPYFPSVFNLSGQPALVDKYGDWFTYDRTPRALIFARDESKVKDLDSMIGLMRYNHYQTDPLSRCEACNPPYSAENAISARNDLNPPNGTYPFPALSHRSHGGTDCKVTNHVMMMSLDFVAIGGPTFDPLPPFRWSTSDFRNLSHVGQPDLWNFAPIQTTWIHWCRLNTRIVVCYQSTFSWTWMYLRIETVPWCYLTKNYSNYYKIPLHAYQSNFLLHNRLSRKQDWLESRLRRPMQMQRLPSTKRRVSNTKLVTWVLNDIIET